MPLTREMSLAEASRLLREVGYCAQLLGVDSQYRTSIITHVPEEVLHAIADKSGVPVRNVGGPREYDGRQTIGVEVRAALDTGLSIDFLSDTDAATSMHGEAMMPIEEVARHD